MGDEKKTHLLFVCTANRQRSPTAADLFTADERYEARSCGVQAHQGTMCDEELVEWADIIFCMQRWHRDALMRNIPGAADKRIEVLDIPDVYRRGESRLVMLLRQRLRDWLDKD